jgi:hypothetical protein
MSFIKICHYTKETLPKDIESELKKLDATTFNLTNSNIVSDDQSKPIFRMIPKHKTTYVTLSRNNELLGFSLFSICANYSTIHTFFIKEAYQKKSFGKKLVRHLLSRSVDADCITVTLNVKKIAYPFSKGLALLSPMHLMRNRLINATISKIHALSVIFQRARNRSFKIIIKNKYKTRLIVCYTSTPKTCQYQSQKKYLTLHRNMLSQANHKIWIIASTITSPILKDKQTNSLTNQFFDWLSKTLKLR